MTSFHRSRTPELPVDIRSRIDRLAAGSHGRLLAAVSGGADSVALARLLRHASMDFQIATVDHGIRPGSAGDAAFVGRLSAELGVGFHSVSLDVPGIAARRGWNLEDAARRLRYSWLTRKAKEVGASHIVTAHTRDDQAETVMMQLLRGAAWLTGMRSTPRGRVLRPLLDVPAEELTAWLRALGQAWRDDPTNADTRLTRAWLRHDVLPVMRARYPETDGTLASLARLQQDQADYVRGEAKRYLRTGRIDADLLSRGHPALQREAVAALLRDAGAAVTLDRLERVLPKLGQTGPWRESLAEGKVLRLAYGTLSVVAVPGGPDAPPVPVATEDDLPEGVGPRALAYPGLVIRSRRPGDRMRLPGGTRKLSDLLIDRKVPQEERDGLKVLASGSDVLWVEGLGPAVDVARDAADLADPQLGPMRAALSQARAAASAGELPVGAVVVRDGRVIAAAHNETEATGDPTAHAELLAIRRAALELGDWRLSGCSLHVTLEPCPMCFGAIQQAHLDEVVYAAVNHREGALGGVAFLDAHDWKRSTSFRRGPLAREASELLSSFFAGRRSSDLTVRWSGADS